MEQIIKIELSVQEWNVVMQALGKRPFAQVQNIIGSMQNQAKAQLEAAEGAKE